MLKQFYEKLLPKQGVYCVAGISKEGRITNRYTETFDEIFTLAEAQKERHVNVYVTPGTFEQYSRKAEESVAVKSFFIDLDIGEVYVEKNKGYPDREAGFAALEKFLEDTGLPPPFKVNSGRGIHAYWIFEEEVPYAEWKPYAELFKTLCLKHMFVDPAVTGDAARLMRYPDSLNYRNDPPDPTGFYDDEIVMYSFQEFQEFLGAPAVKPLDVLGSVKKGLDDEMKEMLGLDNFGTSFFTIAEKSLTGGGCKQIYDVLSNQATAPYDLWVAGLTIASRCDDGKEAIHAMSEEHPDYDYNKTEEKAYNDGLKGPRTCDWFATNFSDGCKGCPHRGKITSPIQLGREFKPAKTNKEDTVWETPHTETIPDFPEALYPFMRGEKSGVYFMPPPKVDKKGVKHQDDPIRILAHDMYPVQRLYSPLDGECLKMRLVLPNDPLREFLVPMKHVYAQDHFKSLMSSHGVFYDIDNMGHVMNYIVKWGQFMVSNDKADMMRMQMGWTAERANETEWQHKSFVIGNQEVTYKGEVQPAPSSPYLKGAAKYFKPAGSFDKWKECANELNRPGLELHAFTMLAGFASPLMCYTSTSGVTIGLLGRSGAAKTGAMYAGLSVFGNPKDSSVFEATDNGMTGRYLAFHNMMLGVDEIGNKDPKVLSQLVHKVSHGKAKIRMQSSVNAERDHEMSASLICVMTTNESAISKFEHIKGSADGEKARMIEFVVRVPECLDGDAGLRLGRKIFDPFRTNYGHAGIPYIQKILELGDDYILATEEKWRTRFTEDFKGSTEYRFYVNLMSICMTAGEIVVNEMKLLDLDLERIYHQVTLDMINIKDNVVKVNKTDYQSLLTEFVLANLDKTLVLKEGGKVVGEPRGAIVARIESEKSLLQVSKTEFKKYLNTRQINAREFEFDMKEKGILFDDKKGRLTTGWKSAIHLDPAYLYWFNQKFPEDLIVTDDD
jgi:hypothetical protein